MKRIPATRIESFTHPVHGIVAVAIADGQQGAGDVGAFLTVDAAGVPTVYGPDPLPCGSQHDLIEMLDQAAARKGRRVDWSAELSEGLSFFGLFGKAANSAADVCVRAACARNPKIPAAEMTDAVHANLKAALAPVVAAIDTEALHALRASSSFSRSDFSFYARGDGSAASMERRQHRLQAAAAYPVLAASMARNLRTKLAIDAAKPLNEELILAFGQTRGKEPVFSKALLRRLHGLDWPVPVGVSPEWLAERIGEIPADWFPKTPEEWDAFLVVARGLGRTLPQRIGVSFGDLVKGCSGKWIDFRRRLAKSYFDSRPPEDLDEEGRRAWLRSPPVPDESFEALHNAAVDLADMVEHFSRLVVLPAAGLSNPDSKPFLAETQRSAARHAAAELLFGGKNAAAMFEISRHYHTRVEHVLEQATGHGAPAAIEFKQVAQDGWAPLCNQVQAPNGVWIVPLTDPRELADEGRGFSATSTRNDDGTDGLAHCVGGYASSCRDSGHHILSFRLIEEGTTKRLSTIELDAIVEGDRKFKVCQHRGLRNGKAPDPAVQAWEWFQDAAWNDQITINYEGIRSYMVTQMKRRDDDVERACGYKWKEEGAFENALRAFDEWLGKGLRQISPSDFIALPEIARVSDDIMPRHRTMAPA
jgi:hypothetical protein